MSKAACPTPFTERAGCPIAERKGGCFSDTDHIVPQRYAYLGWLVAEYIHTPENKQQMCRWAHEQKTETESLDLIPDETTMGAAVLRCYQQGQIYLSRHKLERLHNLLTESESNGNAAQMAG